jgi:hypothetical protein
MNMESLPVLMKMYMLLSSYCFCRKGDELIFSFSSLLQVRAVSTEDVKEELNSLDKAVSSILLQRTMERNLVLVATAKARLIRQQHTLKEEKGEKPAKPEDLVRLYDILIQVRVLKTVLHAVYIHKLTLL